MRMSFDVENIYTQHKVHQHNENIKNTSLHNFPLAFFLFAI